MYYCCVLRLANAKALTLKTLEGVMMLWSNIGLYRDLDFISTLLLSVPNN